MATRTIGNRTDPGYHERYQIVDFQKLLADIGANPGARDGWFANKTYVALQRVEEHGTKGELIDAKGNKVVLEEKDRLKGHRNGIGDAPIIEFMKRITGQGHKVPSSGKTVKKGDKGEIVEEINIRLAGFGGGVPTDTFDETTEKKVRQFQNDYMKMDKPTGEVDDETAKAIDAFGEKYLIDFSQLKCNCQECLGFGLGKHKEMFAGDEVYNKYEYPGIHRSLLWGIRGLMFYLESENNPCLKIYRIDSGYRCHINNSHHINPITKAPRTSTNHMGKAADLHIATKDNAQTWHRPTNEAVNLKLCNKVRDACQKMLNAQINWDGLNRFSLEPAESKTKNAATAPTWVHIDVRKFDRNKYLQDRFFCKDANKLNGKQLTLIMGG